MIGLTTVIQVLLILSEARLNVKALQEAAAQNSSTSQAKYPLEGQSYESRVVPTLRQVLFIHRHGDRTPISFEAQDNLKDEPYWNVYGRGELLNQGKARMYHLGEVMRAKYGKLLGGSVNKNQRITYSSSVLRCLESAELFLASFLRLDQPDCIDCDEYRWDKSIDIAQVWQPASIRSGKPHLDAMLYSGTNCDRFNTLLKRYDHSSKFLYDILPLVGTRSLYGVPIDTVWKLTTMADTVLIEKSLFEAKMDPKVLHVYNGLQKAADLATGLYQDTVELRRLRGGLLLGDLIKNMKKMQGKPSDATKFMHYSTHDTVLTILLGMFESWNDIRVDYSANIVLELHEEEGEWFVELFYMREVPGNEEQLHLKECEEADTSGGGRCSLEKFIKLMQPYLYNSTEEWKEECRRPLEELAVPYYSM